ncbi:MAG: hypothetical protein ABJA50_06740 [Chloroflexota bacterium]
MSQGLLAAGFLRVFGWLVLIGGLVFTAFYVAQLADLWRAGDRTPATTTLLLLAVASLAGGIFWWALCIAIATLVDNSVEALLYLRDESYYEEEEEQAPRIDRRARPVPVLHVARYDCGPSARRGNVDRDRLSGHDSLADRDWDLRGGQAGVLGL